MEFIILSQIHGITHLKPHFFLRMTSPKCDSSQFKDTFQDIVVNSLAVFFPLLWFHMIFITSIIFLGFMRLGTKETNQLIQLLSFFFHLHTCRGRGRVSRCAIKWASLGFKKQWQFLNEVTFSVVVILWARIWNHIICSVSVPPLLPLLLSTVCNPVMQRCYKISV